MPAIPMESPVGLEGHALGRQAVDMGSRRILIAEAGEVAPAHIIDEHQDDVGTLCCPRDAGKARSYHRE